MVRKRHRKSNGSDALLTVVFVVIAAPAAIARAVGAPWPYIGAGYAAVVGAAFLGWLVRRRKPRLVKVETDLASELLAAEPKPTAPIARRFSAEGLNADILLHYHDSEGHETDRLVTVHSLSGEVAEDGRLQPDHFTGYCHFKRGPRTFLVRNAVSAAEPETGEIIADLPKWLAMQAHVQPAGG